MVKVYNVRDTLVKSYFAVYQINGHFSVALP